MKCQIQFSGKNKKKYFKVLSTENFTQSANTLGRFYNRDNFCFAIPAY